MIAPPIVGKSGTAKPDSVWRIKFPKISWSKTIVLAALFGFVAYATYDLTNLATLKNWPVALSLLDMAWGSLLSVVAATAGKAALDRISTG